MALNMKAIIIHSGLVILYLMVGTGVIYTLYGEKYPYLLELTVPLWPLFLLLRLVYLLSVPLISIIKWWKRRKTVGRKARW